MTDSDTPQQSTEETPQEVSLRIRTGTVPSILSEIAALREDPPLSDNELLNEALSQEQPTGETQQPQELKVYYHGSSLKREHYEDLMLYYKGYAPTWEGFSRGLKDLLSTLDSIPETSALSEDLSSTCKDLLTQLITKYEVKSLFSGDNALTPVSVYDPKGGKTLNAMMFDEREISGGSKIAYIKLGRGVRPIHFSPILNRWLLS